MSIIETDPENRRFYDKDPDLMSKSQMLSLRKPCTMPYKYRYIDDIEGEENEAMLRGTTVHTFCEDFFDRLEKYRDCELEFLNEGLLIYTAKHLIELYPPYTDNFINIMDEITNGKFDLIPKHKEVVGKFGSSIGTLDQIWEMSNGELAVIDIKTGKYPYSLADIRLELAFYAELIDAKYIGAMYLGESEKYPKGKFFFEPLTSRLITRLHKALDTVWKIRNDGSFVRKFGFQCIWCDYQDVCIEELTREELLQFQKNKFRHRGIK